MINFEKIEKEIENLRGCFLKNKPFPHIVIDEFCDQEKISLALESFPDPNKENINKSRDYIFAKNKFEKSEFKNVSPELAEIYSDLISTRFRDILKSITGEEVFIDEKFHGGGLHQGGKGSFLDMHADFNFHPKNQNWFRNVNILIYMNKDWCPEYGGELRLRHKITGDSGFVNPVFNRCVIMLTRDYTLHGYNKISFPEGTFRRSIAAYAYTLTDGSKSKERSTTWYPEKANIIKSFIGSNWPKLVKIKNKFLGSSTGKNA